MSARFASLALLVSLSAPASVLAQPFEPLEYIYGISSIDYAVWMFRRDDPFGTRQRIDLQAAGIYGVSIAVDVLTNHVYVRVQAQEAVYCADATTLVFDPEPGGDQPTCSFVTPGATGALTIDPIRRVLYTDGGGPEIDNCGDAQPNIDQQGEVLAYSLDPRNLGTLIARIADPGAGHWATDGNHLVFDPVDRVLWSSPGEWTDNVRPRRIHVGNIDMRDGEFGELDITGLPTIMPGSSIGVDPDGRRIFLVPWNPPTHADLQGTTVADHPEAHYVHVYDMDSYAEIDTLDYREAPAEWDDNTHCGYNTDFKVFFDPIGGWLYETNFYEYRAMFYDLDEEVVFETPHGIDGVGNSICAGQEFTGLCILDLYGFDAPFPVERYELDSDGDGITDPVELGATGITRYPALNDLDPRQYTDPDVTDSDGDGLDDGIEDQNHDGRVDPGESNPADPTDAPGGDYDLDGVPNEDDNCRAVDNPDQADEDQDGIGDLCDGNDRDLDGLPDDLDNCDCVPNPDQEDSDEDGAGDVCGLNDQDGDGTDDAQDNCLCLANPDQLDSNGDLVGDACSLDTDEDTIPDVFDNCPEAPNADQADNCELDGGLGDACSPNGDGDDLFDTCDNCPEVANNGQEDTCDADQGMGDACSPDRDADGAFDACDNCPDDPNPEQSDYNGDGTGTACSPPADTCACRHAGLPSGRTTGGLALVALFTALLLRPRRP